MFTEKCIPVINISEDQIATRPGSTVTFSCNASSQYFRNTSDLDINWVFASQNKPNLISGYYRTVEKMEAQNVAHISSALTVIVSPDANGIYQCEVSVKHLDHKYEFHSKNLTLFTGTFPAICQGCEIFLHETLCHSWVESNLLDGFCGFT